MRGVTAGAWCLWAYAIGLVLGTGSTELLAGAAVAAVSALAVLLAVSLIAGRLPGTGAHTLAGAAGFARHRRPPVPRLCDPDAAGRARPRAPSPVPSAA